MTTTPLKRSAENVWSDTGKFVRVKNSVATYLTGWTHVCKYKQLHIVFVPTHTKERVREVLIRIIKAACGSFQFMVLPKMLLQCLGFQKGGQHA